MRILFIWQSTYDRQDRTLVYLNNAKKSAWKANIGHISTYRTGLSLHPKTGNYFVNTGYDIAEVEKSGKIVQRRVNDVALGATGPMVFDRNARLIIGNADGKIFISDDGMNRFDDIAWKGTKDSISALSIDNSGNLWIGTTTGDVFVASYSFITKIDRMKGKGTNARTVLWKYKDTDTL